MKTKGELIAEIALGFVGTPFEVRGRTPGVGLDCAGVVVAAHALAGLDVPDPLRYRSIPAASASDAARMRRAFRRVRRADIKAGDVALTGDAGTTHMGVVTRSDEGGTWIVHADDRAAIMRVEHAPLDGDAAVRGALRHRGL